MLLFFWDTVYILTWKIHKYKYMPCRFLKILVFLGVVFYVAPCRSSFFSERVATAWNNVQCLCRFSSLGAIIRQISRPDCVLASVLLASFILLLLYFTAVVRVTSCCQTVLHFRYTSIVSVLFCAHKWRLWGQWWFYRAPPSLRKARLCN